MKRKYRDERELASIQEVRENINECFKFNLIENEY